MPVRRRLLLIQYLEAPVAELSPLIPFDLSLQSLRVIYLRTKFEAKMSSRLEKVLGTFIFDC